MLKYLLIFLFFLSHSSFAQTNNTIVVRKKSVTPQVGGLSIKDLYPNLEEIFPLKILSFTAYQLMPQSDPKMYSSESEFIDFEMKEGKGCYVVFEDIRVEKPDGSLAVLDFFYCHSFSKRARGVVTKSLKSWYPDPNIRRAAAEFVSYDLRITSPQAPDQTLFQQSIADDRFLVGHLPYEELTYKFYNITIKTRDGREINVDPFVREAGLLIGD